MSERSHAIIVFFNISLLSSLQRYTHNIFFLILPTFTSIKNGIFDLFSSSFVQTDALSCRALLGDNLLAIREQKQQNWQNNRNKRYMNVPKKLQMQQSVYVYGGFPLD